MCIRHFRTRGSSSSEFATLGSLKQAHPTHGYLQDAAVYEVPFRQRAQVVAPQIQRISSTRAGTILCSFGEALNKMLDPTSTVRIIREQ